MGILKGSRGTEERELKSGRAEVLSSGVRSGKRKDDRRFDQGIVIQTNSDTQRRQKVRTKGGQGENIRRGPNGQCSEEAGEKLIDGRLPGASMVVDPFKLAPVYHACREADYGKSGAPAI